MGDSTITLEKRDHGIWHILEAQCSDGNNTRESIELDINEIEIEEDDGQIPRLSVDGHITRDIFCTHCAEEANSQHFPNSSPLSKNRAADPRAPCELSNPSNIDTDLVDLGDIVGKPRSEGLTPIVTKSDKTKQREAAFIDRRPLIIYDDRNRYADIALTVQPTSYQLTDKAVHQLTDAIDSARQYATSELDTQNKTITATLLPGKEIDTPTKDFARQRIRVGDIVFEAGYVLMEKFVEIFESSNTLARYAIDFDNTEAQPSVPREDSPTPEPVDLLDGHARHDPLTDKRRPVVTEHVSKKAIQAAKRFEDGVSVSISLDENRATWTEPNRENTAIVEFNDGEPVRYACDCSSGIDPCEHIAALLQNLPEFSAVYTGSGPPTIS